MLRKLLCCLVLAGTMLIGGQANAKGFWFLLGPDWNINSTSSHLDHKQLTSVGVHKHSHKRNHRPKSLHKRVHSGATSFASAKPIAPSVPVPAIGGTPITGVQPTLKNQDQQFIDQFFNWAAQSANKMLERENE